mgnify:CR=1 FL=1
MAKEEDQAIEVTGTVTKVKNNVFGTLNVAKAADKYGVDKFILVSTDKAVNPTNVMGASKRMCEMVVGCRKDSDTSFAAVRFGNVLGSNGSVIPLFREQIRNGGPVTITDKRIIRYFMTIPEASQLVIQAGAMAKKGELFVLDMGKPVKIYDLAVNMIKLCGFKPNQDIEIKEIGLRPGEKLFEELLMKEEGLRETENKLIHIGKPIEMDDELFLKHCEGNLIGRCGGVIVHKKVAKVAILLLADRSLKGYGILCDLEDLAYSLGGHVGVAAEVGDGVVDAGGKVHKHTP